MFLVRRLLGLVQAHQRRLSLVVTGAVSGGAQGASTFPEPPEGSGAPPPEEGADEDLDLLFAEGRPTLRSIAGYIQTVLKVC